MKYLLDVNALISAIWQNHVHYPRMTAWRNNKSLAVCPISEVGFLRISTSKSFGLSMNEARSALEKFSLETGAAFVPDSLSALETHPQSSSQVTDIYLANLAQHHGMKLVTFDAGINHPAAEVI